MAITDKVMKNLRLRTLGDEAEESRDDLLMHLYESVDVRLSYMSLSVQKRLKIKEPIEAVPVSLSWLVFELTVAAFNRAGNEGITSESVEGHSVVFSDIFDARSEKLLEDYFIDQVPEDDDRRYAEFRAYR